MTLTIVVATHNEGKLPEIQRILCAGLASDASLVHLVTAGSLDLPDPVETGVTFEQNALLKARDVTARTGFAAIADDSGLIVDVMGAAPGILSARWSGVHGDDRANNRLLLAQLQDIPDSQRSARFCCAAALVAPGPIDLGLSTTHERVTGGDGESRDISCILGRGEMKGRIIRSPRGDNGFGYDPLFVPDDQPHRGVDDPLTSAEMTGSEKNAISHRGKAITALIPSIRRLMDTVTPR